MPERGFDVLNLRPDPYTSQAEIDRAIERIIVCETVRCVLNCNSLDFWQFFAKKPKQVAAVTDVLTMTFCDDLHSQTKARDGWLRRYFKHVAPYNTLLLCDNDKQLNDFQLDYFGAGLFRTHTLRYPGGIARKKFKYEINGPPRILWASRLDEQKGFDSLCSIARRFPDIDFHVFGSALISPTGQGMTGAHLANVILQGAYKDVSAIPIETFDLFLYTSLWDGLPNVLLEMGALGLPIVSSMVGGIPEILNEENCFPVYDHLGLRDYELRIHEALSASNLRKAKADKLALDIMEIHSQERFAAEIKNIFEGYVS